MKLSAKFNLAINLDYNKWAFKKSTNNLKYGPFNHLQLEQKGTSKLSKLQFEVAESESCARIKALTIKHPAGT